MPVDEQVCFAGGYCTELAAEQEVFLMSALSPRDCVSLYGKFGIEGSLGEQPAARGSRCRPSLKRLRRQRACIGARMKWSGQRWRMERGKAILAFRAFVKSGRFDTAWTAMLDHPMKGPQKMITASRTHTKRRLNRAMGARLAK